MRTVPVLLFSAALLAMAAPARADVFTLTYSDGAGGLNATLIATPAGSSAYTVTGITGTFDGSSITGLGSYLSADNKVYTSGYVVDLEGLSFVTGSGSENFFLSGGTYLGINSVSGLSFPTNVSLTPVTATSSVPEPQTYALLGIGLVGMLAMRRPSRASAALRAGRAIPSTPAAPNRSSASMA